MWIRLCKRFKNNFVRKMTKFRRYKHRRTHDRTRTNIIMDKRRNGQRYFHRYLWFWKTYVLENKLWGMFQREPKWHCCSLKYHIHTKTRDYVSFIPIVKPKYKFICLDTQKCVYNILKNPKKIFALKKVRRLILILDDLYKHIISTDWKKIKKEHLENY